MLAEVSRFLQTSVARSVFLSEHTLWYAVMHCDALALVLHENEVVYVRNFPYSDWRDQMHVGSHGIRKSYL